MANEGFNTFLSNAPVANPLSATDLFCVNQGVAPGTSKQATGAQVQTLVRIGSGASLTTSVDVNIPNNANTAIAWNTKTFDTANYYNAGSPTKLTAPATGLYVVQATVGWNGGSAVGLRLIFLAVNAVTNNRIAMDRLDTPPSTTFFQNSTTLLSLTAGDFVEVYAFQTSGASTVAPFTQEQTSTFSMGRIA